MRNITFRFYLFSLINCFPLFIYGQTLDKKYPTFNAVISKDIFTSHPYTLRIDDNEIYAISRFPWYASASSKKPIQFIYSNVEKIEVKSPIFTTIIIIHYDKIKYRLSFWNTKKRDLFIIDLIKHNPNLLIKITPHKRNKSLMLTYENIKT